MVFLFLKTLSYLKTRGDCMFQEREEDIIAQSDLFPSFIDTNYIRAYGLFTESLNHLKALLEENFMLRDYTIANNYIILRVDKEHLSNVGVGILTHELEDDQDLKGWITFRYYYDNKNMLRYETSENTIGFGIIEAEDEEENIDEYEDEY